MVGVWELRVSFSCALCLASPSPRIAAELEKACRVWYRGCDIITVRMRRGMYGGKGDRETEGTPWLKDAPPNRFVPWCYTACGVGFWGMLFILELKPCQLAGLRCAVGGLRGSFFFYLPLLVEKRAPSSVWLCCPAPTSMGFAWADGCISRRQGLDLSFASERALFSPAWFVISDGVFEVMRHSTPPLPKSSRNTLPWLRV